MLSITESKLVWEKYTFHYVTFKMAKRMASSGKRKWSVASFREYEALQENLRKSCRASNEDDESLLNCTPSKNPLSSHDFRTYWNKVS